MTVPRIRGSGAAGLAEGAPADAAVYDADPRTDLAQLAVPRAVILQQAGDYLSTALVFSRIIMIAIPGLALDACLRGLLLLADPGRRG